MTPEFNTADASTWPEVMTVRHISELFSRSVGAITCACSRGRFLPAPMQGKPNRWRKVDVLRHLGLSVPRNGLQRVAG